MKFKKVHFKQLVAIFLCVSMLWCAMPVSAQTLQKSYESLYNEEKVRSDFFADNEKYKENYPNGIVMFPVVNAELKMDEFYAIDIYRLGGTDSEATVKLETVDYTAGYGIDYEIYLNNNYGESPVKGEAALLYAIEEFSFIPVVSKSESQVDNSSETSASDVISNFTSEFQDLITPSSSFSLTFEKGESSKRIYIKTKKDKTVTDDLEFLLNLKDAEGCKIGTQNSAGFRIVEDREKPNTEIKISDLKVNPESDQAYVIVSRGGNLGTYGSYRVVTESDTAKAGEDYEPVQMQLDFIPGMSEQKIPINILDNAESGKSFKVLLENVKNATPLNNSATVTFDNSVKNEQSHETALTSNSQTNVRVRGQEYVPISNFQISTKTNRGIGDREATFTQKSNYGTLSYSNGGVARNNAISIRTKEKINFSGVEKLSMVIDNYSGSCSWDHNAIYISDNDKFNKNTSNFDWLDALNDDGAVVGDSWNMSNVGSDYITRTTPTLTPSKVNGEHYLYIALHKGAFGGTASFKIYSNGDTDNNILLHLKKYNLSIVEPDKVQVYKDGKLTDCLPVTAVNITNPGATNNNNSPNNNVDIYRNETVAITYKQDNFGVHARLKGVVFCNPNDYSKTSELISLSNDSFTLTPELIEKYSNFFANDKIVIKPVYTIDTAIVDVYTDENTIVKNSDGCSAEIISYGDSIGTLNWTKSERENNANLIGDEIKFTFTPKKSVKNACVSIDVQSGNSAADAACKAINTFRSTNNTISFTVSDLYTKITPHVSYVDLNVSLNVKNPDKGDFSGKNDGFVKKKSDGSVSVNGYIIRTITNEENKNDKEVFDFSELTVGSVLSVYATPNPNYRAKWTYYDSITGKEKVYYGNSFFFVVQYSLKETDNYIYLEFESIDSSKQKSYYVNGKVSIQDGSILNPPNLETDIYNVVPNASVTVDKYITLSDKFGEYYLCEDAASQSNEKAKITVSEDETIRALVMSDNQYYITDVKIADCINSDTKDTLSMDLKLDYKTYGPVPDSIKATDGKNNSYNDTIPLITGNAVRFDLKLDLSQQDSDKPVNMVKWTIESEDGVNETYEDKLENNGVYSHYATMLSEIARPGMSMYVELFNVSTNSSGKNVYTTYGKFDTGYNFIAQSVSETVTYAPDIGVPSTMTLPAPCIGPINPTCSLHGLMPVFSTQDNGLDSQGRELKTVTIGLSYSALLDQAKIEDGFTNTSPLDKAKKLLDVLDNYDKCLNQNGTLPSFAGGKGIENALNMKTAVKLNVSVALCFQGNYYVDDSTGEWKFVSNLMIVGFGGTLSVSVPFTFFYIPCFTNISFSLETNIFMGIFPKTDGETGSTAALTLTQLNDAELSEFQGIYEIKGSITFGLGVGFDGLVSASGHITTGLDIHFYDFMTGVGNLNMSGKITLELLFFKYSWNESLLNVEIFNTIADNNCSLENVSAAFQKDLLNKIKLKDMTIDSTNDESDTLLKATLSQDESVLANSSSLVSPSIIEIGDNRYMVTYIVSKNNENTGKNTHKLYYMIYDKNTGKIIESDYVLNKFLNDLNARSGERSKVAEQLDYLDSAVQMIDCGDDILISWTKLNRKITENTDNLQILKSVGIASIYYNKESGKFHDYNRIISDDENEIYINPKVAYNSNTGLTQLFYEKMDLTGVNLDTSVADIQQTPTKLATRYIDSKNSIKNWSDEQVIALSENALNYYDVDSVGDKIVLAFVGSNEKGFTLEDISDFECDESINTDAFNTVNSMYVQQFSLNGDSLKASQQVKITGDDYVTANPEFAKINTQGVKNLLLFYKCNGLYAYQNINTLITQGIYIDDNGNYKIHEDYIEPQFITNDEDYTVNDDFKIVSDDEHIYALWTTTEGTQQQICARSFGFDGMEEVKGSIVRDSNGNPTYDSDGNVILDEYDEPVYLLKGYWGGKTYLTEGGLNGTESGMFKKNFNAVVTDNGNLLTIFNAYDLDSENDGLGIKNNKIVVAEYETKSEYVMSDSTDDLMFSDSYPTAGQAITVESIIKNNGVLNGRDVKAELYVNGEKYAENTYEHWLTADAKNVKFEYVMPDNIKAEDVNMCVKIVENGEVKLTTDSYSLNSGDNLLIQDMSLYPIKNISENSDDVAYRVVATVKNIGNEDYTSGKYVRLMETDMYNLTASMNEANDMQDAEVYTVYGTSELSNIKVGEVKTVSFNSSNISKSVFEKSAGAKTAYLEGIITDNSQIDKTVFKANEKINIISQFYSGLTMIAKADEIEALNLSDLTLSCGSSEKLEKEVTPQTALIDTNVTYSSSDESVATVDNLGVVTALKAGECVITAQANGITSNATVTVTETPTDSDNDKNGDSTDNSNSEQSKVTPTDTVNTGNGFNIAVVIICAVMLTAFGVMIVTFRRKNLKEKL